MIIPEKIDIEIVRGICTANCPMCSINETRYNKGVMSTEIFKKIVDSFKSHIENITVNLVGIGEMLVDVKLHEKIKYLKKKKVKKIILPTNASLLTEKRAIEVLDAGLDEIIFGVDSLKKEVYEKIRQDLIFEEVYENVKRFIKLRDEHNYKTRICVRMIVSKLNNEELDNYLEYWKKYLDKNKGDLILYFPEHNWAENDYPNKDAAPPVVEKDCKCVYVYDRMNIDTYGNVKFCCIDINGTFFNLGNVLNRDPIEIFNNEVFSKSRNLMDNGKINEIKPCASCNVPLQRSERNLLNF